jgi:ureidoacrylate peracid hydrolase
MSTTPFEPISWNLEPDHTALVVIDAQNDFLHPDGWYSLRGVDIDHMRRTIEPIKELVSVCHERGVPIIWTRHGFRDADEGGWIVALRPFLQDGGLRRGTWGYEVLEELDPRDDDRYVEKTRLSAFYQTDLELKLRALRAETVLVTGVLTNQCVAATGKDAMFRDFKPIVVEEATGTTLPHLHAPALEMMQVGWAEVRSLQHALEELRALPAARSAVSV